MRLRNWIIATCALVVGLAAPAQAVDAPPTPAFPSSWNCQTISPQVHAPYVWFRWSCTSRVKVHGVGNLPGAANLARPIISRQGDAIGVNFVNSPFTIRAIDRGHRRWTAVEIFTVYVPVLVPDTPQP